MIAGISVSDLVWLAAALLVAGAVTGFLAGIFGVGGGTVIVPVLYEFFKLLGVPDEVRMPLCVGTSLAVILPTSIRSFRTHFKKGAVDMAVLKAWAVPIMVGVALGAWIARYAPEEVFKGVFIVVAAMMALRLLFGRDTWRLGEDLPKGPLMSVYGGVIGVLSSLMGIGGGQLCNLVMSLYNRPIHQAVATSSGVGTLIAIPGTIGYIVAGWAMAAHYPSVSVLQFPISIGYVSLLGFILFVPTTILTAPIGAHLAHALSKRTLEVSFGVYLLAICLRFFYTLL